MVSHEENKEIQRLMKEEELNGETAWQLHQDRKQRKQMMGKTTDTQAPTPEQVEMAKEELGDQLELHLSETYGLDFPIEKCKLRFRRDGNSEEGQRQGGEHRWNYKLTDEERFQLLEKYGVWEEEFDGQGRLIKSSVLEFYVSR
jgi:hypothetical protein